MMIRSAKRPLEWSRVAMCSARDWESLALNATVPVAESAAPMIRSFRLCSFAKVAMASRFRSCDGSVSSDLASLKKK